MAVRRGEVYFVDLEPTVGREQAGRRPVVVVSNDLLNAQPLVVIVVPGTKRTRSPSPYPSNLLVRGGASGLVHDTVFLTFQMRALDPSRFQGAANGSLSQDSMDQLDRALAWTLALESDLDLQLEERANPIMDIGGVVLCGGQSKRMGRPKAWLPFVGEILLPRVVRLLGQAVQPIVVVAAPDQQVPPLPLEVVIVRDEEKGRGPLQGLAAGLAALRGRAEAAFLSSCDVPFLRPAFVRRLCDLLGNHAICVPRVGDYHHPLAAVYRLEVMEAVGRLLVENRLRPFFLFEAVPTRVVEADELRDVDPAFQTLRNLNTPEEYEAALREVLSEQSHSEGN